MKSMFDNYIEFGGLSSISHDYKIFPNGTIITDTKLMTPAQRRRYNQMVSFWENFDTSKLNMNFSDEGMIYLPRVQSKILPHEVIITENKLFGDGNDIDSMYGIWQNETNSVAKRFLRRGEKDRSLARINLANLGLVALIEGKLNYGRHIQGTENCFGYKEVYREE